MLLATEIEPHHFDERNLAQAIKHFFLTCIQMFVKNSQWGHDCIVCPKEIYIEDTVYYLFIVLKLDKQS